MTSPILTPASEHTVIPAQRSPGATTVAVDVVLPVYNEIVALEPSLRRLHTYLTEEFPFTFRITIADNASTDGTDQLAAELAGQLPNVRAIRLPEKGRGRALRAVWSTSDADVLTYMDIDLSTDLAALLPLVAPLLSGHSDLAIGSRLSRSSRVVRGPKREVISRCYNLILRGTLSAKFSDAQCGFKAIRREVAERLLPLVQDTGWFFDTEMLVLAERAGLRIHEVPVDWVDDPDSRVNIISTALADLRGVARLTKAFLTGALPMTELREALGRDRLAEAVPGTSRGMAAQLIRFGGIGVLSTLAYLLLYGLLRGAVGPFSANLIALLTTAVANTAANRRLTFGIRGRHNRGRQQAEGLIVFGIGLLLTTGALGGLALAVPHAGRPLELGVLVAANLAATVLRFLLFRSWVFHPRRGSA
ncbi:MULTISPECIES: bifunctional glycosyltransferase family 2/GtrA family protein [Amycolatopsis]|uniref:dolichyl-phosphate beta-glucosyltransferase n=1 Tax=Amycolatopsis albidoflavus TaxID=102226 RepID=A0ABW5I9L1_9PSEU